jgi:serine/threonine protein kinase
MSKSGFKPPTLKEKTKWSPQFHHFVKTALTKNPKKRPPADRLIMHSFLSTHLSKKLMRDLLEKARNPHSLESYEPDLDPDEEVGLSEVPRRISSKKSTKHRHRPSDVEPRNMNYEVPLVTELSTASEHQGHMDIASVWGLKSESDSRTQSTSSGVSSSSDVRSSWSGNEPQSNQSDILKRYVLSYSFFRKVSIISCGFG